MTDKVTHLTPMAAALAMLPAADRDRLARYANRMGISPDDKRRWGFVAEFLKLNAGMTPSQSLAEIKAARAALYGETPEGFDRWLNETRKHFQEFKE
ncbi:MAG: hypothetical protein ACYCXT_11045 [Acidiferrobacteraceae bacterium]